jgi:ATP-dependent RNA helicase SUPV3L1/SUV3
MTTGSNGSELERSLVLALGPTNTGKTHRAVERMLEHETGMIGLPLRLLAREVYDRVSAALGESQVALVTGEEKRVPRAPRYWVCTVEAMPIERPVDFLAIDEVQLAAHRERGHVFTERILHARGGRETWLLGADTMAPLLRQLLPDAQLTRQLRFSALRHAGRTGLGGLPPRSAVVTFRAEDVYELAARLRARKGGAAVVLGALSPRTRNAQVALYEAREVQYLVATDAIGMGLNLDVDHVAFAGLEKFDGKERRPLDPAEVGQIAGRAGRYRRDGTFGTVSPLPAMNERLVRRIEEHRFPPVTRLVWRSAELDFESIDALLASLATAPPHPVFARIEQADDFDALRALAERPRVRERARGEASVGLLWEVCQIPDYRKLLLLRHVQLLEEIFLALHDEGRLETGWVDAQIRRIDQLDGEIDTLVARLAAIRVWTYVTHRAGWTEPGLEERAREVEDRLGDALHERLVERFVGHGERVRVEVGGPRTTGHPFAQLGALLEDRRRAEADARERSVARIVDAPHEAFEVDDDGVVRVRGSRVGKLVAGRELAAPGTLVALDEEVGAGARSRIERRLAAFAKDLVSELLAPLRIPGAAGLVRGILYQLEQGLGTADAQRAHAELAALDPEARQVLAAAGIEVGRRTVHARALLTPEALRLRALLVRVHRRSDEPRPPPRGGVTVARSRDVPPEAYLAAGFVALGPRAVRVDMVERASSRLATLEAPFEVPPEIGRWLGVRQAELPRVLAALGYRVRDGRCEPQQLPSE